MYLKNLKNLDLIFFFKSYKIIILRAKHFNLYYFLIYSRSIDQKIKELDNFYQNLLPKKVIKFNNFELVFVNSIEVISGL